MHVGCSKKWDDEGSYKSVVGYHCAKNWSQGFACMHCFSITKISFQIAREFNTSPESRFGNLSFWIKWLLVVPMVKPSRLQHSTQMNSHGSDMIVESWFLTNKICHIAISRVNYNIGLMIKFNGDPEGYKPKQQGWMSQLAIAYKRAFTSIP